jgi:hypothetical protein
MLVATKQTSNFSPSGAKHHARLRLKSWGTRKFCQNFSRKGKNYYHHYNPLQPEKLECFGNENEKISSLILNFFGKKGTLHQ